VSIEISNKKAYFNYEITRKYEAGLKLIGSEVKSIKGGKGTLTGSYVKFDKSGELWLIGFCVPRYLKTSNTADYDESRPKKLLLNKHELSGLYRNISQKGMTIAPLKLYIKRNLIKLSIGLAKGKKKHQRKAEVIEKEIKRKIEKQVKEQIL